MIVRPDYLIHPVMFAAVSDVRFVSVFALFSPSISRR